MYGVCQSGLQLQIFRQSSCLHALNIAHNFQSRFGTKSTGPNVRPALLEDAERWNRSAPSTVAVRRCTPLFSSVAPWNGGVLSQTVSSVSVSNLLRWAATVRTRTPRNQPEKLHAKMECKHEPQLSKMGHAMAPKLLLNCQNGLSKVSRRRCLAKNFRPSRNTAIIVQGTHPPPQ